MRSMSRAINRTGRMTRSSRYGTFERRASAARSARSSST
nr:MAG TPA: hypothetical protein [Caudoviricetes sp.]